MTLMNVGTPRMTAAAGENQIDPEDLKKLMAIALDENDSAGGYRVVRTTHAPLRYKDTAYNRLMAHANLIRQGKVAWIRRLGRWDARARMINDNTCGLYMRYLGE